MGLKKYDVPVPLVDVDITPGSVKLMLAQGIGVPAVSALKAGDAVKAGELVAFAADGKLSAPLHAPIDGRVAEIADGYVVIIK